MPQASVNSVPLPEEHAGSLGCGAALQGPVAAADGDTVVELPCEDTLVGTVEMMLVDELLEEDQVEEEVEELLRVEESVEEEGDEVGELEDNDDEVVDAETDDVEFEATEEVDVDVEDRLLLDTPGAYCACRFGLVQL
jgi:hypothetical protein